MTNHNSFKMIPHGDPCPLREAPYGLVMHIDGQPDLSQWPYIYRGQIFLKGQIFLEDEWESFVDFLYPVGKNELMPQSIGLEGLACDYLEEDMVQPLKVMMEK